MATFTDFDRNLQSSNQDLIIRTEVEAINNAITNILTVVKGELPGRPDFGSNLQYYLHELIDGLTLSAIEDEVYNVLIQFEERIEVVNVIVTDMSEDEVIYLKIEYTILNSGISAVYSNTFDILN